MTDNAARQRLENMNAAPRCGAKTRAGHPCRGAAVRGKNRCRMHGGRNPGAPKGNKRAWKHGRRSAEAVAERKLAMQVRRDIKQMVAFVEGVMAGCQEQGYGDDKARS